MKKVEIVKVRSEDLKPGMVVGTGVKGAGAPRGWARIGGVVDGAVEGIETLYALPDTWPFENQPTLERDLHPEEIAFYIEVPEDGTDGWDWYLSVTRRYQLWDVQVVTETLDGDPELGRVTRQLEVQEIETALRALAELYDNSDDNIGDYLSERQQEIAERVSSAVRD